MLKHSRKTLLLALLLGLSLLLAACAPAAKPADTTKPEDAAASVVDTVKEEVAEKVEEVKEEVAEKVEDVKEAFAKLLGEVKEKLGMEKPALLLSLEELANFDGKDGKPALVAVDGILYDVTGTDFFPDGVHKGNAAGLDLSEALAKSPHGAGVLEKMKAVGRVKLVLTSEELATFNGKDGKPAYVAVDGIVYDVTASDAWKNGEHNGFEAGKDLTDAIKNQSPHGISKLENVVEVGVLISE